MSRATLKPIVSKLREAIIKGVAGELEKYGFDESGMLAIEKPLSEYDEIIRANLIALFEVKNINDKVKYIDYIHNTSRTLMHILICYKYMEKCGIMGNLIEKITGTDIYSSILPDFTNVNPLAFDEFSKINKEEIRALAEKDESEEDIEYYQFIYLIERMSKEMSKEVKILFGDYEYNIIQPDFNDLKQIIGIIQNIADDEYFEDDFLGWIYQYWVDVSDEEKKTAKAESVISYSNVMFYRVLEMLELEQSENGEFYTPRWVVQYVVDNTLGKIINSKPIEKITLLDPACGAGNYLVYAFDVFYKQYKVEHGDWNESDILESILANNIHGVDIQREPLQIAALNLWFKTKVISANANVRSVNLYKTNILQTSSLYHWEKEQEEFVQLSLFEELQDIKEKKYTVEDIGRSITIRENYESDIAKKLFKKRYDVIVMNPPFVDTRNMAIEQKDLLKAEYPNNSRNLASAFMQRAHELCTKNGLIGFIASDTFMSIQSFEYIREQLLNRKLQNIVRLGLNVFDGPLVHAVIFVYKNVEIKKNKVEILDLRKIEDKEKHLHDAGISKEQAEFGMIKGIPFIYEMSDKLWKNISKAKTLDEAEFYDDILTGLQTGNVKKYTRYMWEVPHDEIGTKWLIYEKGESSDFYRESNLVVDWSETAQKFYTTSSSARSNYLASFFSEGNKSYYLREGITYNLTSGTGLGSDRFNARVFAKNAIFSADTPTLFIKDETWYFYALGLLNCNFVSYMLKLFNPTIHFTKYDLTRIPYIEPNSIQKNKIDMNVKIIINDIQKLNKMELELFKRIDMNGCIDEEEELYIKEYKELSFKIHQIKCENDKIFYGIYDLEDSDIERIEDDFARNSVIDDKKVDKYWITLNYLRYTCVNCLKDEKLLTAQELVRKIQSEYEMKLNDNAYLLIENIEEILGNSLAELIIIGAKRDGVTTKIFGNGSKDLSEHFISTKIVGGKGKMKEIIFWYQQNYLMEYLKDKKYELQNEIRRLTNDVYLSKLQRAKEKLQVETISASEKKTLEKEVDLYQECVKTLENWKVVD